MKTDRFLSTKLALVLLPILLTFGAKGAIAQITPAKDGTGTIVNTQNNQLNISGGTQAGSNQFHSFQQFGVNAGQTANFLSNPGIMNILGRVTGGDASLINGMLKVSGSNANLYLINPSGIVFGKDASLNVPAAFTATTANGIGFGNGNWFNAIGSNNYATLTANPTSFGFVGTSGSLVNAGNLSVNPGQSIALVGGTIVNTGTIAAPGGNITIAAIPGGKMVRIGQAGTVLSLDLPTSDKALINAPITTPLSLPALLTGGSVPSAMGVVVEDGVIKLTGGSASVTGTLNADGTGLQNGGNVVAYADNHLSFGGTISAKGGELGGNGGFVDTSGRGTIAIAPNAKVLSTAAKGLTGTWLIDPADLEVVARAGGTIVAGLNDQSPTASTIGADTIVAALDLNNVELKADNSITVNATIDDSSPFTRASNLKLTARTVNLNKEIKLNNGILSGTATTVNVGANGTVQNGIDVSATGGTVNLAATTYKLANQVDIYKDIIVRGAGAGSTTVSGEDKVRVFSIDEAMVTLDRMSIVNGRTDGYGGGIYNGGTLTVNNSTLSGNASNGRDGRDGFDGSRGGSGRDGYGGGISNFGTLTVNNSTLSGNTSNGGRGGIGGNGFGDIGIGGIGGNGGRGYGGGISNFGTLTVNNSTLSGNISIGGIGGNGGRGIGIGGRGGIGGNGIGGGIFNGGTLTVNNSTFSRNSAQSGGGIFNGRNLKIGNSIVSGNTAPSGRELWNTSTFTSQGYNLFGYTGNSGLSGSTPLSTLSTDITPTAALSGIIGSLASNGGPTQTHALVLGSAAIDAGDPTLTTPDQRGKIRQGRADIGAFEWTVVPVETPVETPVVMPVQPGPTPTNDLTRQLEPKDSPKPLPTIVRPEPILCVERSGASASSSTNPYQGIATCGATTTQGKAIAPKSRRSDR